MSNGPGNVNPQPVEQLFAGGAGSPEIIGAAKADHDQADGARSKDISDEIPAHHVRGVHRDERPGNPDNRERIDRPFDRWEQDVARQESLPGRQRSDQHNDPPEKQGEDGYCQPECARVAFPHPLTDADRKGGLYRKQYDEMVDQAARRLPDKVDYLIKHGRYSHGLNAIAIIALLATMRLSTVSVDSARRCRSPHRSHRQYPHRSSGNRSAVTPRVDIHDKQPGSPPAGSDSSPGSRDAGGRE